MLTQPIRASVDPSTVAYSHHGFAMERPTRADRPGSRPVGHPVIQYRLRRLWEMTSDPQVSKDTWAYKREVLEVATEMFRNGPQLHLVTSGYASYITDEHREFLKDCLRYVETGRRDMAVTHWQSILSYETLPASASVTPDSHRRDFDRIIRGLSPQPQNELIERWCQRPGGYVDLAYTLKILYLCNH